MKSFYKKTDLSGIILLRRDLHKINKLYPILCSIQNKLSEISSGRKQYAKEIAQEQGIEIIKLYEPNPECHCMKVLEYLDDKSPCMFFHVRIQNI